MASRILWQTKDYTIQNFPLEPRTNGLPRREGGKFRPKVYSPDEDRSHVLSPLEFRAQYAPSFESGSVVEEGPVNRCGTGHRKVENSSGSPHSDGQDEDNGESEM
jgi:hypothetical protein